MSPNIMGIYNQDPIPPAELSPAGKGRAWPVSIGSAGALVPSRIFVKLRRHGLRFGDIPILGDMRVELKACWGNCLGFQ